MPKSKNAPHNALNNAKIFGLPPLQKNALPSFEKQGKLDVHHDNHQVGFTFSTDLASVTGMNQVNGTNSKAIDITTSTFKTTVGLNAKNVQSVLGVLQKSSDTNFATTHIYGDTDGDGQYSESFDIHVAKVANGQLSQKAFTFNTDGSITATAAPMSSTLLTATAPLNIKHGVCAMDQNVVLNKVTLNNVVYVTKTVANLDASEYHFGIFRDDNNDGVWTEIAHGETSGENINATTKTIDLVGIQSYLVDASAVVG